MNKINYKKVKPYDTAKKPLRQSCIFTGLMYLVSKLSIPTKYEIEKIGVEGLKPPYILLSNHMHFVDFKLNAVATFPHKTYNVATIDGYYRRPLIMELIGCICKRKFTNDMHLLTSIDTVLKKHKGVLSMYPEARYSPVGTTAILPDSLGMLVKKQGVPVVTLIHHGNYLHTPFWNYRKPRKVKLHTAMKLILTPEQLEKMSYEEINEVLRREMSYNEYDYQLESNQHITDPDRAEGLHNVLYQCPHCLTESKMTSKGSVLKCEKCGKEWELTTLGRLEAKDGDTEFSTPPEWYEWQRANVRAQIEAGEYSFEDEVDVYSLPHPKRFEDLGKAKLTHDPKNGFVLTGSYNGEDYRIQRKPLGMYGVHIEYDYCYVRQADCIDISTEKDSFYCYPKKENVVTKLSLATEEIYKHYQEARLARKRAKMQNAEQACAAGGR